jgi:Zn-dependent metalloprotease
MGRQIRRGKVVRTEGGTSQGDEAVDEAYDGLGSTFDFFHEVYGRNSIDDEGMRLDLYDLPVDRRHGLLNR